MEICGDNRFDLIKKYKDILIESTNIDSREDEMKVIDSILFRFGQMDWLDTLEKQDKYEWHDLRNNPNDLPTVEKKVEVCCKYKNRDDYIYTHALYEDGKMLEEDSKWCWYDIDGKYDEEHDCYIIPEGWWEYNEFLFDDNYNNVIDAKVIAWREIIPFEGGGMDE